VYAIDGFEIALRKDTARGILISVQDPNHATADRPRRGFFGARGSGFFGARGRRRKAGL
jgi:hypothetical protein